MYTIQNDLLKVDINSKGAELNSIYHKGNELEYMWSGDPAFWGKHSPVLFPIVGTLKGDIYYFEDKEYHLGRHGFARDMVFAVTGKTGTEITFSLESNQQTLEKFPFFFRFDIIYSLHADRLKVTYRVINTDSADMFFSVGGHPAFKVPLLDGLAYEDYYLEFTEKENAGRWPISKDGLIETFHEPLLNNDNCLPLTKSLFYNDALVLKGLTSLAIFLKSNKAANGLEFNFSGFPYLGIWAAKDADFVCIEPWCGIADSTETNQQFTEKEGINKLSAESVFERSWSVRLF